MRNIRIAIPMACALASAAAAAWAVSGQPDQGSSPIQTDANERRGVAQFAENGELLRPNGCRRWVFIGSSVTPNDMNNGRAVFPEFHNVYIDPQTVEHYAATGRCPQGAVLVKELVSVGTKQSASGRGYFQGHFHGLGVMVKDKSRFPNTPGNWGYFDFTDPPRRDDRTRELIASAGDVSTSCIDCHNAAESSDYVFSQHYPIVEEIRKSTTPMPGSRMP